MSKFDLKTIVSHVSDNPLLEPNRYEVIISGPISINKDILFNCHACDIPGHSIGSFEHSIIGPQRKLPSEELFDDLSVTFYNNDHLDELKVMNKWMKMIGGNETWRMAYYNDIVADMQINIYDLKEHKTNSVKIFEVYPVGSSEVPLSYAENAPSDITINFTYHSYEIESA